MEIESIKFDVESDCLLVDIQSDVVLYSELIGAIYNFLSNEFGYELRRNNEDYIGVFNRHNQINGDFAIETISGEIEFGTICVDFDKKEHTIAFPDKMYYRIFPIKIPK